MDDVLGAAVTGSLRRYPDHRDSLVDDIRALVPFDLRPLDQPLPRELGNQFVPLFASLRCHGRRRWGRHSQRAPPPRPSPR